ncbi:MAG: hypothetical protein AB7O52_16310 [Planctomycetota bacterium]
MEGGPLLQDWWANAAKGFIPFLHITARIEGRKDDDLLGRKGGRGFPYCVFMDAEGKVLKEVRPTNEKAFLGGMSPFRLLAQAQAAAAKSNSEVARIDLALIEAVNNPKKDAFEALGRQAETAGVNPEIKQLFVDLVATWPVREALEESERASEAAGRDRSKQEEVGKKRSEALFALYKKGVNVTDSASELYIPFWVGVAEAAAERRDVAAGERSLGLLESYFADNQRALEYFKGLREKLTSEPEAGGPAGESKGG